MLNTFFKRSILLLFILSSSFKLLAQHQQAFLLTDAKLLAESRAAFKLQKQPTFKKVEQIIADADKALTKGPFSVTFNKTKLAPSEKLNDYISQAPYWWPDPTKADGLPYIRKDGQRNPEIYKLNDRKALGDFCEVMKELGLGYYYTGEEKYAIRAKKLLEVYFINDSTKMNPELTYAQYIPGLNDGRGIGIIESRGLIEIPEAMALFNGANAFNELLIKDVKNWFRKYNSWLINSVNGKSEQSQTNNHGTNYDLQVVDFALFTGDEDLAKKILNDITIKRVPVQFTKDGSQPLELARTKSWDYVNMNLDAWVKLAILSDHLGVNLWDAKTANSGGIKAAVSWLMPFVMGEKKWTHQQLDGKFETDFLHFIMRKAASHYPDLAFEKVFSKLGIEKGLN